VEMRRTGKFMEMILRIGMGAGQGASQYGAKPGEVPMREWPQRQGPE
jgi:hypothetical protein